MQQELLTHAMNIFDSVDKWNAFIDLANQKDTIKDAYFSKVKEPLFRYFHENQADGWVCEPWGDQTYDMRWYLKDFGKNSLGLGVGWRYDFVLTLEDPNRFDIEKMYSYLKSPESGKLLAAFERIDSFLPDQRRAIVETGNYSFDSPFDGNFKDAKHQLAWYAGNQTENFVRQIVNKVEKFRKNKEVTDLLYQINEKSKKY